MGRRDNIGYWAKIIRHADERAVAQSRRNNFIKVKKILKKKRSPATGTCKRNGTQAIKKFPPSFSTGFNFVRADLILLFERWAADFVRVVVNVEGRRRKIFERDRAAVDFENNFSLGCAVRGGEVYVIERQRIFVVEAENYIFAVAFCIIECVRAVVAP